MKTFQGTTIEFPLLPLGFNPVCFQDLFHNLIDFSISLSFAFSDGGRLDGWDIDLGYLRLAGYDFTCMCSELHIIQFFACFRHLSGKRLSYGVYRSI